MATAEKYIVNQGRNHGLEEAATALETAAAKLLAGKRVPAVDKHTAYVLQRQAHAIRALKS